jgi:hypothetical protein
MPRILDPEDGVPLFGSQRMAEHLMPSCHILVSVVQPEREVKLPRLA